MGIITKGEDMEMTKKKYNGIRIDIKKMFNEFLIILVGTYLISFAINVFLLPNVIINRWCKWNRNNILLYSKPSTWCYGYVNKCTTICIFTCKIRNKV